MADVTSRIGQGATHGLTRTPEYKAWSPASETTEWSLVLDGDPIDSTLGHHHEMNGLDEATARRRNETWKAYRPDVQRTLRKGKRITYVGPWEVVAQ